MHSKQLGNLGELRVAADLVRKGYFVFTELGDICKSDLIVLDDNYKPIKIQVKTATLRKSGAVTIKSSKSGPNYRFKYKTKHANIYAVFIPETNEIAYISNKELLSMKELTIRVKPARNGQTKNTHSISDYSDFERALRDCTRST